MEPGRGYWLRVSHPQTVKLGGCWQRLVAGQNLIAWGCSSEGFDPVAPAEGLAPMAGNLVRAWGYQGGQLRLYDPQAALFSDLEILWPGEGYWVYLKESQVILNCGNNLQLKRGWNLIGWC